jgi:hypothetical protein
MGDEEIRESKLPLQVFHEVDHLRLYRDVECRDGLVADDEFGVQCESPRETDPLALTPRELMRVTRCRVCWKADDLEKLSDSCIHVTPSGYAVHAQWLADDTPNGVG